jgi:hypothetical protein
MNYAVNQLRRELPFRWHRESLGIVVNAYAIFGSLVWRKEGRKDKNRWVKESAAGNSSGECGKGCEQLA